MNLRELNASENGLSSLPPSISQLYQLKKLLLSHNDLGEIPLEISGCSSLQELDLSFNKIYRLPDQCAKMNIVILNLSHNHLLAFPQQIPSSLVRML